MKPLQKTLMAGFFSLTFIPSGMAKVEAYPQKGQSSKQQEKDKYECYQWAKKETGFDPEAAAEEAPSTGEQPQRRGGAGRGAAKGAAAGAIGGAIGGDVGKGAAIGAGVGAVGGGARHRKGEKEAEQKQEQAQTQEQELFAEFDRAQAACLKGRGYSVD